MTATLLGGPTAYVLQVTVTDSCLETSAELVVNIGTEPTSDTPKSWFTSLRHIIHVHIVFFDLHMPFLHFFQRIISLKAQLGKWL